MSRGIDTPLRLVTLFRDRQVYHEPENPKLGTWKQDLTRREQELEDMNAVRPLHRPLQILQLHSI